MREIKIKPEGWIEKLVFEDGIYECGTEKFGFGIYVTKGGKRSPGGVIKREDMKKLINLFSKRLKEYPLTL